MPVYTYACCNCWEEFDARRSVEERATADCPRCGTTGVKEFKPCHIRMPCKGWGELTARSFLGPDDEAARNRVTVTVGSSKVCPRV